MRSCFISLQFVENPAVVNICVSQPFICLPCKLLSSYFQRSEGQIHLSYRQKKQHITDCQEEDASFTHF